MGFRDVLLSEPKRKSEEYAHLGGMDSKTTSYDSTPLKFLDLQNYDFFTPGALSQRWGSTMYFGQTFPGPVHSLFEFARLDGSSYVVSSYSGGIYYGATTGQNQGISFTFQGATIQQYGLVPMFLGVSLAGGASPNFIDFALNVENSNYAGGGARYKGITSNPRWGLGITTNYAMPINIAPTSVQSDNTLDHVVFQNWVFAADGNKFFKFDGATTYAIGLPPPLRATTPAWTGITISVDNTSWSKQGLQVGPSFGTYYLYLSYVNNRGFESPAWPLFSLVANTSFNASLGLYGLVGTTLFSGWSAIASVTMTIGTPLEYGISAINVYSFYDTINADIGQTFAPNLTDINYRTFADNVTNRFWNLGPPVLLNSYPSNGSTFITVSVGTTSGAFSFLKDNSIGRLQNTQFSSYEPLGITTVTSPSLISTIGSADLNGFFPRYLELYQNRLFCAGFSLTPSTVWFSDIAEPEGYKPDFNFEVRTNDGDVITAMRAYQSRLYIFKEKSFHLLVGDDQSNFDINQISDQYGCVNNRSVVVYHDILLFLDRKGVMMWNGAGIQCLSTPIQPTFDRMNYAAARTEACGVHDKLKNQVIFSIPVDGATTNNLMCVYDYNIGQWTTYKGANASAMQAIVGRNGTKNVFYGDYQGRVNWMGASFLTDNGVGFTTYLKSRFFYELGQSSQKMYRRLYLNANNDPSATLIFNVNFFKDYSASTSVNSTMVLSGFQNRIDFGISARSIAFELSTIQTNLPLKIHGFTIESRLLRRV